LTCVIAIFAYCWLPESPTKTTGVFWRKPWFTEREEKIMINRVLRDDPAKGLTALHNKISFADIKDALSDRHLWPLIFLGLIAYIPQRVLPLLLVREYMKADHHSASVVQESRSRIFDLQPEAARVLDFQQVSFFCGNYFKKHLMLTHSLLQ
jgi:hypothetical protein